jgi:hypothetical protein
MKRAHGLEGLTELLRAQAVLIAEGINEAGLTGERPKGGTGICQWRHFCEDDAGSGWDGLQAFLNGGD